MRRLYFLIPDVESAKVIVDELLLARIEARHIHIAGSDHHVLTEANLPEANLLQESDFVPAVERGLAIGGATGIWPVSPRWQSRVPGLRWAGVQYWASDWPVPVWVRGYPA